MSLWTVDSGLRTHVSSQELQHSPQRDPHPVGSIVQLVGQLVQGLVQHERIQQALKGLRIGVLTDLHRSQTVSHELVVAAVNMLMAERPDLTGVRFAAFGLGDSIYETFNNAIETLRTALLELGAEQIGTTAKHDAASTTPATELADAWTRDLLTLMSA